MIDNLNGCAQNRTLRFSNESCDWMKILTGLFTNLKYH